MKAADLQVGARVVIQDGWAQREAATVRTQETDNRPGFGQVFSRRLQNDRRARGATMRSRLIVIGLALVAGCASGPRPGFDTSMYRVSAETCSEHKAAKLFEVNASMGSDGQIVTASEIPKSSNVKGVLRVIVHDKDKIVCGGAGVSVLEVEPARDPAGAAIPLRYKVLRKIPPSEWQD